MKEPKIKIENVKPMGWFRKGNINDVVFKDKEGTTRPEITIPTKEEKEASTKAFLDNLRKKYGD